MPPAVRDDARALNEDEIQILWHLINEADRRNAHGPQSPEAGKILLDLYDEHIGRRPLPVEQQRKYFRFILRLIGTPTPGEKSLAERFVAIFDEAQIDLFSIKGDADEDEDEQPQEAEEDHRARISQSKKTDGRVDKWLNEQNETEFTEEDDYDQDPVPAVRQEPRGGRRSVSNPIPRRRSVSRDGLGRMRMDELPNRDRRQSRASSLDITHQMKRSVSRISDTVSRRAASVDNGTRIQDAQQYGSSASAHHHIVDVRSHYYDPSLTLLPETMIFEQAEAFREMRGLKHARNIIRRWADIAHLKVAQRQANVLQERAVRERGASLEGQVRLNHLEQSANEAHRAFEEAEQARLAKERDAAFDAIDVRAGQAYEDRLKELALSQWHMHHADKAEDTEVARRHMTKTRCFVAWYHLSATSSLKVQAFRRNWLMRSSVELWRHKLAQRDEQWNAAVIHYDTVLLRRTLRYCLLRALGQKFYDWIPNRIAQRTFHAWHQYVHDLQTRLDDCIQFSSERRKHQELGKWRKLAQHLTQMNEQAQHFRSRNIVSKTFSAWKRASSVEQRSKRLTTAHEQKLVQACLQNWVRQALDRREADVFRQHFDRRKALSQLRLQFRAQVISREVEARLGSEALYKWCLAAKAARSSRELDQRLVSNVFNHWANQVFEQRAALEENEEYLIESRDRKRRLNIIQRWQAALESRRQQAQAAEEFRNARLVRIALSQWCTKSQHISHLNRQSDAARFYVLTSHALRVWRDASTEHQKMRRRDAYAEVRRQHKVALARNALHKLQDVLAHRRALVQMAAEREEDRLMKLVIRGWDRWREATVERVDQTTQADEHRTRYLTSFALTKLHSRASNLTRLNYIADSFSQAAVERSATFYLRRLDRRIFRIQAQAQTAVTLRNRLLEKHIRGMLRYWHERTLAIREARAAGEHGEAVAEDEQVMFESSPEEVLDDLGNLGAELYSHKAGQVISEEGPSRGTTTATGTATSATLVPSTSTPLPGYLRTPSKRNTALAKARFRLLELGAGPPAINANERDGRGAVSAARMRPLFTDRSLRNREVATPATAPVRGFRNNAATTGGGEQQQTISSITPFESKLRRQGYRTSFGTTNSGALLGTPGVPDSPATAINVRQRRDGGHQPSRLAFGGFDDITETGDLDGEV